MNYISEQDAKEMICEIGRRMYKKGFVSANDGNITIRVGERELIATPTGVSKGALTPDMLIKMDFDGNVLDGTWKPTSELKVHLTLYKNNDEIMSTCHCHSLFLTSFADTGIELDEAITPSCSLLVGRVPVIPYAAPGSKELGECVGPYAKDYKCVLLANHGPFTWGKSPIEAWYVMEDAENYARMSCVHKFLLTQLRPMSREQVETAAGIHHIDLTGRKVNAPETTNNLENCVPFSSIKPGLRINEEDMEKIAELVAAKLGK